MLCFLAERTRDGMCILVSIICEEVHSLFFLLSNHFTEDKHQHDDNDSGLGPSIFICEEVHSLFFLLSNHFTKDKHQHDDNDSGLGPSIFTDPNCTE